MRLQIPLVLGLYGFRCVIIIKKIKQRNFMNCLYFTVWAQNQLRSGNNKQPCCHLIISYTAGTMLLFMPHGSQASVIVGTPANSALGLVTQGFSGHLIRHSWCHRHIRCLAPHTMVIETPGWGLTEETPHSPYRAPGRAGLTSAWEVRGPDPQKAGCVPGCGSFSGEKMYGLFPLERG